MYQVELYYELENQAEIVGDTTTVRRIRTVKSSKQKKFRIKRNKDGTIVRDNSNTLKQYGLKIYQAQVTGIDWETSFDERLDLQKNEEIWANKIVSSASLRDQAPLDSF